MHATLQHATQQHGTLPGGQATLKPRQVAEALGCHVQYVYSLIWSGKFVGAVRTIDGWQIPVEEVRERLRAKGAAR